MDGEKNVRVPRVRVKLHSRIVQLGRAVCRSHIGNNRFVYGESTKPFRFDRNKFSGVILERRRFVFNSVTGRRSWTNIKRVIRCTGISFYKRVAKRVPRSGKNWNDATEQIARSNEIWKLHETVLRADAQVYTWYEIQCKYCEWRNDGFNQSTELRRTQFSVFISRKLYSLFRCLI